MKPPKIITRPAMNIVGFEIRTKNQDEAGPKGKIGPMWQKFMMEEWFKKFPQSAAQSPLLGIYTNYASDVNGEYSLIIGKEVKSIESLPSGMMAQTIPASKYAVFTTPKGEMPGVVVQAWQHIWSLSAKELGGERAYLADFELYDDRCADRSNAELDIYISIK